MSIWHTLSLCFALVGSGMLMAGSGAWFLRLLEIKGERHVDSLLYSVAVGAIFLDLAVSLGVWMPNHRVGVHIALAVVALVGLAGVRGVFTSIKFAIAKFGSLNGTPKFLAVAVVLVLASQCLASFAPMTGSDALHYHFTVPSLTWNQGFQADWSLLHGFFCGLSHQLILAGIALGSSKLAQGWVFLGGAVGTVATLRVAQLWIGGAWPWLSALAFALTPVVFWQIIGACAPDIWMCAFVPLCVLAILRARENPGPGNVVLAGVLAGATAGTKYTGVILAAGLFAAFFAAIPSTRKALQFFATAVVTGFWPYLRNWIWTGDPVFPFFFARAHRGQMDINQTAINSILNDTGATHSHSLADLIKFPLFAVVDQQHFGAWLLLGPLVLAFAPLAITQLRKTPAGRVALIVWILGALGIGFTSGMPRFLLPLLPVALAASVAGIALFARERFRVLRVVCVMSLGGFILAGLGALVVYSRPAWSVVTGRTSEEAYLLANSPDYERTQFVNREVARFAHPGRVLLFFRHVYYVRVPFLEGDPENSGLANPQQLTSPEAWTEFFAKHEIRWVLKSPAYPNALADSLNRLEQAGILRSCASGEIESFTGNRMAGNRTREAITLYCLKAQR